MGKRGIALIVVVAAFFGSFGVARADWTPPSTCGEPTLENPLLEPCGDPLVIPPTPVPNYLDIDSHWARNSIRSVAYSRDWLRLGGSYFRPKAKLTRLVLAYGLVRTFGRDSFLDPDLVF